MYSYIISSIMALLAGQIVNQIIKYIPTIIEEEKAYRKFPSIFNFKKNPFKIDYIYSIIYLILFNLTLYKYNYSTISYLYMIAFTALTIALVIDFKMQLIPDTSIIIILIVGTINLIFNFSNATDYILGFITGGVSFYLIRVFSKLAFKKEGMGLGDVKLVAAIGFLVGYEEVLTLSLIAFMLSFVVSILLLILKKTKLNNYIPFGPFIAVGALFVILFGSEIFISIYLSFCTWLGEKILNLIYRIIE